jgi:diaminohydroxyphosphoribosylaminopyrimidine deaminase/5-amino-6-(5-phosphoribosylamino)uracil reductase
LTPLDRQRLHEALALAESSFGLTEPNPRVGCVIGNEDGRVLGRGATQQAGGAHAEVMALREARAAGLSMQGATAWVTLEPCAHHGRTPPCCDALIDAGIARAVVAVVDPFPLVRGAGIERLRAAGIDVEMADAEIAAAATELNIGFFSRVQRGRPWLRMKVAASLDGRTALPNGVSQWITGEAARADGHAWRRRAGAVLTGIGTALADDPRLDVRLVPTARQPLRVVVDSRWRLPAAARMRTPPGPLLVYGCGSPPVATGDGNVEHVELPSREGQVDLHAALGDLARRGVNELHVEAGATLNGALLRSGLVDEVLVYLAPRLLGPGRGMAEWPALVDLQAGLRLRFHESVLIGDDLRVRCRTFSDPASRLTES